MIAKEHLQIVGLYEVSCLVQKLSKRTPTLKSKLQMESIKKQYEKFTKKR